MNIRIYNNHISFTIWKTIVVLFISISTSYGQENPLVLTQHSTRINLTPHIACSRIDASDTAATNIKHLSFKKKLCNISSAAINQKTTNKYWWFRVNILNLTKETQWYVSVDYPPLNSVSFFLEHPDGRLEHLSTQGVMTDNSFLVSDINSFYTTLKLLPDQPYKLYIRVISTSFTIVPASLMSTDQFVERSVTKYIYLFSMYALVFAALLFNIILYITIRERSNLIMAFIILTMGMVSYYQFGFGIDVLFFVEPYLKVRLRLLIFVILAILINIYTVRYLEISKDQRMFSLFRIMNILFLIYGVIIVLPWIPDILLNGINPFVVIIHLLACLIAGMVTVSRKYPLGVYYTIGVFALILSSLIFGAMLHDIIPFHIQLYQSSIYASAFFCVILTFGLIQRIRRLNQSIKESEKLKALNRKLEKEISDKLLVENELKENILAKDKLFGLIGHDLINPFNAIMGFSELLCDEKSIQNKELILNYAEIINISSKQAFGLLQKIQMWSRAQRGKIEFKPTPADLNDLITDGLAPAVQPAIEKGIRIEVESFDNAVVNLDITLIRTVLNNLIINSVKFTEPGGNIKITCSNNSDELTVSVKDSGIGLTDQQKSALFRIETAFTTLGTANEIGSGLGLLICKEYIDLHKGTIHVESTPGQGSTFTIRVPV